MGAEKPPLLGTQLTCGLSEFLRQREHEYG